MSDNERDQIESMGEEFIRNCETAIKTLRSDGILVTFS